MKDVKLVLIGGSRNADDAARVEALRLLAKELQIEVGESGDRETAMLTSRTIPGRTGRQDVLRELVPPQGRAADVQADGDDARRAHDDDASPGGHRRARGRDAAAGDRHPGPLVAPCRRRVSGRLRSDEGARYLA